MFTDLTMPGLSGIDVARQILAARPDLPIIITTGHLRSRDVDSARAIGVRHFLPKPFTLQMLAECLREAFAES